MNHCFCADGWNGTSCMMCNNDTSCQKRFNNDSYICDTSLFTNQQKFFQCNILDDNLVQMVGPAATFSCEFPEEYKGGTKHENGTCQLQMWATDSGNYPSGYFAEVFFCTFMHCSFEVKPPGPDDPAGSVTLQYDCTATQCNCSWRSDKCGGPDGSVPYYVMSVVQGMKTTAQIVCNNVTQGCIMTQNEFPVQIPLNCLGGECLAHNLPTPPVPPIPPPPMLFLMLTIGSAVTLGVGLVLLLCVSAIWSCITTHIINSEYLQSVKTKSINVGASLEFINITYMLQEKLLLKGVSHKINSGEVVAIMGPSGAGKSTLLDILAGRNKRGSVNGEVLINGQFRDSSFKRISGYVFQDDNLMPTLTVRECLAFSANLRLPSCITAAEKRQRVNSVMEELGIMHIAERRIGDSMNRGISGGEKRRVSIGMELVSSPSILFLDEPTSGLDSYNAVCVMESLVRLAKNGRTIVFSIHQPRSNIFSQFDQLILLSEGQIEYKGPASQAIPYFTSLGYSFPTHTNPADHLIDILEEKRRQRIVIAPTAVAPAPEVLVRGAAADQKLMDQFQNIGSSSATDQQQQQQGGYGAIANLGDGVEHDIAGENSTLLAKTPRKSPPVYATSWYAQLKYLSHRAFINFLRNFFLMPSHYGSSVLMGVLLGLIYWQEGINLAAIQNRIGSIFFMCALLAFNAMSSLELFIAERSIYVREVANGYYTPSAYFFSKILFDLLPLRIIPPIILGSIAYWMIGLHPTIINFAWFLLMMILFNVISGGICLAIGAVAPTVASGNVFASLLILAMMLFGGFLLNRGAIPSYLSWLRYLSVWNYSYEALLINELHGVKIWIDPVGLPPLPGDGDFILNQLQFNPNYFYTNILFMFGWAVFFIALAAILLKFFVREKR